MTDHANELRRYARKIAHPAGDVPSVMLAAAEEIERLAARLEATESEALEEARLNGMGSEREAALMAKLEAAEKTNREWLRANAPGGWIDNLRAKIEQMERQEPVAWTTKLALEYGSSRLGFKVSDVNMWGENGVPLYALPGAKTQGEEK